MPTDMTAGHSPLRRAPIGRDETAGVTIAEIEDCVREIYPGYSPDQWRTASLLFAVLKEGSSIQKLQWFTRYEQGFLRDRVEWLRSRGLLFTGSLSAQFVLKEVPGSEDLIERITGQRMARKEIPKMERVETVETTEDSGSAEAPKKKIDRRSSPEVRARLSQAMKERRAREKAAGAKPKRKANGNGRARSGGRRKPDAVDERVSTAPLTAVKAVGGLFKIEYEDQDLTIKVEGIGRESFAAAVQVALGSLGGGSNA